MSDTPSKAKGLAWAIVACALGFIFAVGLSPLAHAIPWSWEKKLSNVLEFSPQEAGCHRNPQAQGLLRRLVNRIYPVGPGDAGFSIDVQIVNNPAVNAYAALGGKISVNTGLLEQAESPEEVAGVLAHEIGHVQHRHIMEGAITHLLTAEGVNIVFGGRSSSAEWTRYFLNMSFTRSQETQADEEGLARLQKAHVDNRPFRHFFERMEKSESAPAFLSDHPSSRSRSELAATFENQRTTPIMTQDEWKLLKAYCSNK